MTLLELVPTLQGEILIQGDAAGDRPIQGVVASDLMSDVLVVTHDDFLLVTSLASDQMIRTADLVGAAGVIVVNGKHMPVSILQLAEHLAMPLIRTWMPKYETCLLIGDAINAHTPAPDRSAS